MICSPSPAAPRQAIMPDRSLTCSRAGGSKIPSQPVFFQRLDEILEALGEIDSSHLDHHSSRIATGAAIPSGRRMRTTGGRSPVERRGASRPIRGSWIASPPTFVFSLFCMTAWPRWTTRAASERALTGSTLGEFWKYRVGDYRVIASIEDRALCVLVVKTGNRREVYRKYKKA